MAVAESVGTSIRRVKYGPLASRTIQGRRLVNDNLRRRRLEERPYPSRARALSVYNSLNGFSQRLILAKIKGRAGRPVSHVLKSGL